MERLHGKGHAARASVYPLDVTSAASLTDFRENCVEAGLGGKVDILFNNAGVCLAGGGGAILEKTLAVNFFGALGVVEACLPAVAGATGSAHDRTISVDSKIKGSGNSSSNTNTDISSNTNTNINANSNTNSNTNANPTMNANANANINTNTNTNTDTRTHTSTNTNANTNTNTDANTNTYNNTNTNTNTNKPTSMTVVWVSSGDGELCFIGSKWRRILERAESLEVRFDSIRFRLVRLSSFRFGLFRVGSGQVGSG